MEFGADGGAAMIWNPMPVRILVLGACTCLLWGCAATSETYPIKPQVTITGTSVDRVKTALVSEMSKRKFRVAKNSGHDIAFEQPASSTALQGLSSSAVRGDPIERVTYAVAPEKDDMHVTANIVLVRKLAAMEQETDINQGPEGQAVQAILAKIASDVGTLKTSKAEN
jgi:hypothetical protein